MLWLEERIWQQAGLAVAGSLAWYDYSAADAEVALSPAEFFATSKSRLNNDARFIDWAWSDPELATRLGDGLCQRLQELEADAEVRAILVVTHVPLFEEQMCRKPGDITWGISNAYFGNVTLGQRVLEARKVRAVVSGHTHMGREGYAARSRFPDAPPVAVSVIASEYGSPGYVAVDSAWL
jgi:hypothetical protein